MIKGETLSPAPLSPASELHTAAGAFTASEAHLHTFRRCKKWYFYRQFSLPILELIMQFSQCKSENRAVYYRRVKLSQARQVTSSVAERTHSHTTGTEFPVQNFTQLLQGSVYRLALA